MHSVIYSLRTVNGKPVLDYSIGLKIVFENYQEIHIQLSTGIIVLKKGHYINQDKIYDDGNVFFMLATKKLKASYCFNFLLEYACSKLDNRIGKLETLKQQYKEILNGKILTAA